MSSTNYIPYKVNLSEGQIKKLSKAYKDKSAITLKLENENLTGQDELMLTKTQINKLNKAKKMELDLILKFQKHKFLK